MDGNTVIIMTVPQNCFCAFRSAVVAFVCLAWLNGAIKLHADTVEYEGNGASTNGIYASIKYSHIPLKWDSDLIEISLHFSPPSTNIPFVLPHTATITNGHIFSVEPSDVAIYFSASNLSSGPIRLLDSAGNQVPLFKTNRNSEAAYPDQYSLTQARESLNSGHMGLRILEPVAITGTGLRFDNFNLPDTFKIVKPGDYKLIIWPKIYKRSETNRDIVHRIDLPPVTIPIKWTGT